MLNVLIFGAPGSGKGTQSEELIRRYGFRHISTGELLRAEIKAQTELGQAAAGYINEGHLVPDSLIVEHFGRYRGDYLRRISTYHSPSRSHGDDARTSWMEGGHSAESASTRGNAHRTPPEQRKDQWPIG